MVALDPFNLSLEMSLSCSDCSPSQIALVKDEGQEINFANLNQMFTDSVIAIEGNELTQAGNINFKFTDIPLLASEYETTSFIAVLRIKDSNSYRVYKLGAEPVSRVETLLSTSSYATADFETPAVSSSGKWYTSKRSNTSDTLTYDLYEVDIASGAETLIKTYTKAINDAQDATFAKIEGVSIDGDRILSEVKTYDSQNPYDFYSDFYIYNLNTKETEANLVNFKSVSNVLFVNNVVAFMHAGGVTVYNNSTKAVTELNILASSLALTSSHLAIAVDSNVSLLDLSDLTNETVLKSNASFPNNLNTDGDRFIWDEWFNGFRDLFIYENGSVRRITERSKQDKESTIYGNKAIVLGNQNVSRILDLTTGDPIETIGKSSSSKKALVINGDAYMYLNNNLLKVNLR